jgi:hypothetical protein
MSVVRWLTHGWGLVLLGSLIALVGTMIVPTAATFRRRRSLAGAGTAAERVEVEWDHLTGSLRDLGIAPAPSRTPRQQRSYYEHEALLVGADSLALGRVVQTVESSRYAVSFPPRENDLSADAHQVLRAAAANRAGRYRLRAAMWPGDGITQLRSACGHLGRLIRTPLVRVSDLLHRPRRPTDVPEATVSLKRD